MDRILDRFGHVQEEYEHLGGYALESQAPCVLPTLPGSRYPWPSKSNGVIAP
jgi:hypothetical protein